LWDAEPESAKPKIGMPNAGATKKGGLGFSWNNRLPATESVSAQDGKKKE